MKNKDCLGYSEGKLRRFLALLGFLFLATTITTACDEASQPLNNQVIPPSDHSTVECDSNILESHVFNDTTVTCEVVTGPDQPMLKIDVSSNSGNDPGVYCIMLTDTSTGSQHALCASTFPGVHPDQAVWTDSTHGDPRLGTENASKLLHSQSKPFDVVLAGQRVTIQPHGTQAHYMIKPCGDQDGPTCVLMPDGNQFPLSYIVAHMAENAGLPRDAVPWFPVDFTPSAALLAHFPTDAIPTPTSLSPAWYELPTPTPQPITLTLAPDQTLSAPTTTPEINIPLPPPTDVKFIFDQLTNHQHEFFSVNPDIPTNEPGSALLRFYEALRSPSTSLATYWQILDGTPDSEGLLAQQGSKLHEAVADMPGQYRYHEHTLTEVRTPPTFSVLGTRTDITGHNIQILGIESRNGVQLPIYTIYSVDELRHLLATSPNLIFVGSDGIPNQVATRNLTQYLSTNTNRAMYQTFPPNFATAANSDDPAVALAAEAAASAQPTIHGSSLIGPDGSRIDSIEIPVKATGRIIGLDLVRGCYLVTWNRVDVVNPELRDSIVNAYVDHYGPNVPYLFTFCVPLDAVEVYEE